MARSSQRRWQEWRSRCTASTGRARSPRSSGRSTSPSRCRRRCAPAGSTTPTCSPGLAAAARRPARASWPARSTASKGPTPDPCGVCDSCRALAPDGAGSIDVIEIDAASHGGVDDARDLRERAFFAPVCSRFKVYVIDEAHMVSSAGLQRPAQARRGATGVREVRLRDHRAGEGARHDQVPHPPLPVPADPAGRAPAVSGAADRGRGGHVEPAVFPLVVRAGGGSARDSLSVLDQLIAGAGPEGVTYARAVALLGVTDVDADRRDVRRARRRRRRGRVRHHRPGRRGRPRPAPVRLRPAGAAARPDRPAAGPRRGRQGPARRPARPARADGRPGHPARPGDAVPLRRHRAQRAGRDARHDRAAAAAGADHGPHAAARCGRLDRRPAAAAGADGAAPDAHCRSPPGFFGTRTAAQAHSDRPGRSLAFSRSHGQRRPERRRWGLARWPVGGSVPRLLAPVDAPPPDQASRLRRTRGWCP